MLLLYLLFCKLLFFFFKQKTAYNMRISDWSSDVCSSDLSSTDDFISPKGGQCDDFHPCPRCERSKRPPVTAALSTQPLSLPSRRLRSVIRSARWRNI